VLSLFPDIQALFTKTSLTILLEVFERTNSYTLKRIFKNHKADAAEEVLVDFFAFFEDSKFYFYSHE
jgi:hypothetical protein